MGALCNLSSHPRAAEQKALSCQAVDKLANPSILVRALATLIEVFLFNPVFVSAITVACFVSASNWS